jgi:FkbM family methyltransferase
MWVKELISRASLISGREVVWEDSRLQKFESQLGQDLLAIVLFGLEHTGYFVEFGATNGRSLSNTWILEKQFGWTGILCEPAKTWHRQLLRNRSCKIDFRCVSNDSGRIVRFSETKVGELSTISSYADGDMHASSRVRAKEYGVETVSLNDLLTQHDAPRNIDFLSIDTEGGELDILMCFDFSAHSFGLICVEHNYSAQRDGIRSLLNSKGYRQILPEYSFFDDWYINAKILKN